MALARKVKQGQLLDTGCLLETTQEGTFEIPWDGVLCVFLGRIEPTRMDPTQGSKPGPMQKLSGAVMGGVTGMPAAKSSAKAEPQKETAFLALDLYAAGQDSPFRLDTLGTNLRKFLGEEAGYSGEMNMVALVRRLAEAVPNALDDSVRRLLERGKSALTTYPDVDAFRAASTAAAKGAPLPTQAPTLLPKASIPPAPGFSAPMIPPPAPTEWQMPTPTAPAIEAGLTSLLPTAALPALLTATYAIGMVFVLMAAKMRLTQNMELPYDITWWLLGGCLLSLAAVATIKGRHSVLREYMQSHTIVLRAWVACAAVGCLLFGICLGFATWGLSLALVPSAPLDGAHYTHYSFRVLRYYLVALVGSAAGCLLFTILSLNLLLLTAAPDDQLLDSPTVLHRLGIG